ncbi:MAG TPA: GNAT family N-acetyltransferase [Pyrinomonadaceae bacterium]|jgi:RimJ/RimL family protein N-acetyltransferase|nr:GNAT family N-acetyltransferase [Pyrinomonadaceae bacterium]
MAIIVETERLILRTWLLNDLKDFLEIYGDPEVWRYVDPNGVLRNETAARRSLMRGQAYQQEHGFCHWAVVEKSRGRVIGACGFNLFRGGPQLELVYHFARLYWGRGYATEAVRACLRYASEKLGAPEIVASIDSENLASRRVLEKIGFIPQGNSSPDNPIQDFYFDTSLEKKADEE